MPSGEMILNVSVLKLLLFITVRPVNHLKRPLDIYTFEDGSKRYQMVWEELVSKHTVAELQNTTFQRRIFRTNTNTSTALVG